MERVKELIFNGIKINLLLRRALVSNCFVELRNKEFNLLKFLLQNRGRVISRTEILEEVWDRNIFCPTNTVDVHISNLRKKLRSHQKDQIIKTVHSVGYLVEP